MIRGSRLSSSNGFGSWDRFNELPFEGWLNTLRQPGDHVPEKEGFRSVTLRHRLSADLPFSHPENTTKKERLLKDNTNMAKKARLRCLIRSVYKVGTTQSIAPLLQTMQQIYLK